MSELAIVVIAYNREHSLKRLLSSIAQANYSSKNITLHISIDASDNPKVAEVANSFEWHFGEKIVDVKPENRGLLKHVLECGELAERYGSILVLEDDLIVAPAFYSYGKQASAFFAEDARIGGVSLYTYPCEENNYYPFQPIVDGSDVHFIQVASSWGQVWTKNQWTFFKQWLIEHPSGKNEVLPKYVQEWGDNSWKKLFIGYLIDTDRYFAFPNTSYSTNFEDEGTHATNTGLLQVSMNTGEPQTRFRKWKDSNAVYDAFFELKEDRLKALNPRLEAFDFEVDIYGEKSIDQIQSAFILTSRRGKNPAISFGSSMKPILQNIIYDVEGRDIGIYRKEDLLPAENLRFLNVIGASSRVEQYANLVKQRFDHVSVIMPVLENQLDRLKATFEALPSTRFHEVSVLLVCPSSISEKVAQLVHGSPLNTYVIESKSSDIDELFRLGIAEARTKYCVWAQPGMPLDLVSLENAGRIFQSMHQVQAFVGCEKEVEEDAYERVNVSHLRWTPQIAISNQKKCAKVRTEWVFWRRNLFSEDDLIQLTTANLFVQLLKRTPVYPVALKLTDYNKVKSVSQLTTSELKSVLSAREFQPKTGLKSLFRPIFSYWFHQNVRFFRLFYRELEQLPTVVRFDFEHNSFYLGNY